MKQKIIILMMITFMFITFGLNNISADSTVGNGFDYGNVPSSEKVPDNVKTTLDKIWGSVSLILKIAAVGGVIFAGVRYMFAYADQKADLKKSLAPLVIGIIIVFGATTLVDFIVGVFTKATNT
jgi:type IV secretory pathway VirB2 component (pilin)